MSEAWLYEGVRSPRARAKDSGGLHDLTPHELLAQLYSALETRSGIDPACIEDVILGCVTQHGEQAGNIARASLLFAGWPATVPGMTVNRYCSSGIDAIALAALKIRAGEVAAAVAGGVEMMSRVPMLADNARVFRDPAFAASCRMLMMGSGADLIASLHKVSREDADAVALASQARAAAARDEGRFARSLVSIETRAGGCAEDECIREGLRAQDLAGLPPAFADAGAAGVDALQLAAHPELDHIAHIHTAGNSPAMADGAALLLVGNERAGQRFGLRPRARVRASVSVAADPLQVLTGCLAATSTLLEREALAVDDVDLYEIHEAFAAVSVVAERELAIPGERLNVNGGVIALGHPMGATGAIMALNLLDELERRGLKRGLVAAAGAAGSGCALVLERP